MEEQAEERSWFTMAIKGAGLTTSAGFMVWIVRGEALLAGLLGSLPAWRYFDPVPILNIDRKEKDVWAMRVQEATELEAHEHHGLDQILQRRREEGTLPPSSKTKLHH